MSPVNIAVLISGSGTNLEALINSINKGYINGKIKVVISNRENAYGLVRAKKNSIEAIYINRKEFNSDVEFDLKILDELKKRQIELVVLAGYLKVLSKEFVNHYRNRIINIHPSLIPSFCGKGYYGEKVHRAVLEYGVKITGATVHFVDERADTGPIILQEAVKVDDNDTVDTLKEKVLKVEHKLLPMAVKLFCENKLEVIGKKVIVRD